MGDVYTVRFGRELDGIWFTANISLNRWEKARRAKQARQTGFVKFHACPRYERATLTVTVISRTGRRFDILNPADIVKPLIDGAIDAGILPDDDVKHLPSATFIGEKQKGGRGKPEHEIILTFTKTD